MVWLKVVEDKFKSRLREEVKLHWDSTSGSDQKKGNSLRSWEWFYMRWIHSRGYIITCSDLENLERVFIFLFTSATLKREWWYESNLGDEWGWFEIEIVWIGLCSLVYIISFSSSLKNFNKIHSVIHTCSWAVDDWVHTNQGKDKEVTNLGHRRPRRELCS